MSRLVTCQCRAWMLALTVGVVTVASGGCFLALRFDPVERDAQDTNDAGSAPDGRPETDGGDDGGTGGGDGGHDSDGHPQADGGGPDLACDLVLQRSWTDSIEGDPGDLDFARAAALGPTVLLGLRSRQGVAGAVMTGRVAREGSSWTVVDAEVDTDASADVVAVQFAAPTTRLGIALFLNYTTSFRASYLLLVDDPYPGDMWSGDEVGAVDPVMWLAIAADYDGDGRQDLVAVSQVLREEHLYLWRGVGDLGTYERVTYTPVSDFDYVPFEGRGQQGRILGHDLDDDGQEEIVVAMTDTEVEPERYSVRRFDATLANPGLELTAHVGVDGSIAGLVALEAGPDRAPVLVVGTDRGARLISVLDSSPTLAAPTVAPGTGACRDIAVGDLDGDGDDDVVCHEDQAVSILCQQDGALVRKAASLVVDGPDDARIWLVDPDGTGGVDLLIEAWRDNQRAYSIQRD